MNVLLKGREVEFYVKDPEAKVLFAWHDFAEAAETGAEATGAEVVLVKRASSRTRRRSRAVTDVAERDGGDTAVILYTSGTTGTRRAPS